MYATHQEAVQVVKVEPCNLSLARGLMTSCRTQKTRLPSWLRSERADRSCNAHQHGRSCLIGLFSKPSSTNLLEALTAKRSAMNMRLTRLDGSRQQLQGEKAAVCSQCDVYSASLFLGSLVLEGPEEAGESSFLGLLQITVLFSLCCAVWCCAVLYCTVRCHSDLRHDESVSS